MIGFIAKRLLNYIILTAVATLSAYLLVSSTLQPAARFLGRNPPIPQSTIDIALDNIGANPEVPLIQRMLAWVGHFLTTGSLGQSVKSTDVTVDIVGRAGTSLRLLIVGAVLAAIFGVLVGVWGAVRQYRAFDQVSTVASFIILATPTFVIAVVLMILATMLNNATGAQIINFAGEYTPGVVGFWPQLWDRGVHLLLPTLVLVIVGAASYSRYQRSAMLDVLSADFIRTARSKGLPRTRAIFKHGVRVALIPMSTFFAYSFGTLLAGATFVEKLFGWHGTGEYFLDSISNQDINAAVGTVLFNAVLVLIAGTLADVLYAALDPRVRL